MATLARSMSLVEKIKFIKNNKLSTLVELMGQEAILSMIPTMEANNLTSHRYQQRVALPGVTPVTVDGYVPTTVSQIVSHEAPIRRYASVMTIDKQTYQNGGGGDAYQASELRAHLMSHNINLESELFYGSTTNPLRISGLSNVYNSLTGNIGQQVISAGSVSGGDAMSAWLIGVGGSGGLSFIYPQGAGGTAGIETSSPNTWETETDASGNKREVRNVFINVNRGIVVPDYRAIFRICNIDRSALLADSAGSTINVATLLMRATSRALERNVVGVDRYVLFVPRSVYEMLQAQSYNKGNGAFTYQEIAGREVTTFNGVEIRKADSLLTTETTVS